MAASPFLSPVEDSLSQSDASVMPLEPAGYTISWGAGLGENKNPDAICLASGLHEPCGLAAVSACQRRLFSPLVDVAVFGTSLCCPTGCQERTVGDAAVHDQRRCFVRQLHGDLPRDWTSGLPLGGCKLEQGSCPCDSCSRGPARGHETVASLRQCPGKVAAQAPSRNVRCQPKQKPPDQENNPAGPEKQPLRPPAGTQTVERTAGSEGGPACALETGLVSREVKQHQPSAPPYQTAGQRAQACQGVSSRSQADLVPDREVFDPDVVPSSGERRRRDPARGDGPTVNSMMHDRGRAKPYRASGNPDGRHRFSRPRPCIHEVTVGPSPRGGSRRRRSPEDGTTSGSKTSRSGTRSAWLRDETPWHACAR